MRLRTLLATETLGLRLLHGEDRLDHEVRAVMTTDLRDPCRYLSGGELVLTGLAWRRAPGDSEPFVARLAAARVAALAAGEAESGPVPADLVAACRTHGLPLFAVSESVSFASITDHVTRGTSPGRAGELAAVIDRHRLLMADGPAGAAPAAVLELLASGLDAPAWLLSPLGRVIAASHRTPLPPDAVLGSIAAAA
ncbi:PucR family transcriptional regulator ligand-binding domain-containing protein, partial [Streptomyces sp. SM12]|uniref:PucR family transcriptional regulator ligand-binding domain-containing protein n=2 Tax=unclassified Streptomyces TaxID=2593676 RepID=UPI0015E18497